MSDNHEDEVTTTVASQKGKHLTEVSLFDQLARETQLGQATWAGSGPEGRCCAECAHWDMGRRRKNRKKGGCWKFHELLGMLWQWRKVIVRGKDGKPVLNGRGEPIKTVERQKRTTAYKAFAPSARACRYFEEPHGTAKEG